MTIAVCPGSYDPVTAGHLDVIERCARFFDEVHVVVAVNAAKTPMFSEETRVEIIRQALEQRNCRNVKVASTTGLITDYCKKVGATVIVKGLRQNGDYEAELGMALVNRKLADVETLFLPAAPDLEHISSSIVKDVARHGGDVTGMVQRAIDLAYEELSDKHNPRLYQANMLPELHTLLCNEDIALKAAPTWWEVTDALFDRGFVHEAIQAQRYAVPLLGDITTQINQNQGIINSYEKKTRSEAWRSIIAAISAYAVLKEPTRFDLGDAQIVSLDLDEVATHGGPGANRQSAVMYMLARHVLGARFFLMPDDVKLMPERYQDYHAERIEAIREDPKRLCYEKAHSELITLK